MHPVLHRALGVRHVVGKRARVAVERRPVRRVDGIPVDAQQPRVRIRVCELDRSLKGDVPLVVGEVEHDEVGFGHLEVFRQELGVAGQPDSAIGRVEPVPAVVIALPGAVAPLLGIVLPGVPRRREARSHVFDCEALADVVADARKPFVSRDVRHIVRRMVCRAYISNIMAGGTAEMVVIDVRDKDRVESRNVCRRDGRLEHHGHVEAFEHGVDHDAGAAGVQQKAGATQPCDRGAVLRLESPGGKLDDVCRHGLPAIVGDDGIHIHDEAPLLRVPAGRSGLSAPPRGRDGLR